MANAYTTPSDVFAPQRIGQSIKGYIYNNHALSGSGFIGSIAGATWSAGGKQVTFPKYTGFTGGSSANASDGTKVDSKKVTVTSVTADCVSRILSIAVDKATLQDAYTDPDVYNYIINQVGEVVVKELDLALVAEAETSTLLMDADDATIAYDDIIDGLKLWGDKMQQSEAMLVVHSKVYADLLKLAEVKDSAKFGYATMPNGRVPVIAGCPVYVSDNVTVTDLTSDTYTNLIVRRNAVRFGMRSEVDMEIKTEPGNTMRYLDFDWRYIVDLEQSAQLGVIKLVTL